MERIYLRIYLMEKEAWFFLLRATFLVTFYSKPKIRKKKTKTKTKQKQKQKQNKTKQKKKRWHLKHAEFSIMSLGTFFYIF